MSVIARLASNKIAKNTSALMLAQMASRLLGVLYIGALARYVGTQGIGVISTATSVAGLAILLVGPGLDTLLVRDVAVERGRGAAYAGNVLLLKLALALPFFGLLVVIARLAHYPADTLPIIYTYVVVYLLDALCSTLASVFQAFEHMEYDALTQVARDAVNVFLSLACIALHWSLLAITLASLAAQVVKLLLMSAIVRRRFLRPAFNAGLAGRAALLVTSLPFGVLLILHTVQAQLGSFMVSLYRPASEVGIYSSASTLVTMLLLLAGAFSTAIFPAFSSLHAGESHGLRRLYRLSYKYLLIIGFPLGLGTILLGEQVISLVYGDRFAASAPVIKILGLYLFALVGYANGPLLNAVGKQRFFAWTQALAVLLNVALCVVMVPRWGASGAATAMVVAGVSTFFVHSAACHRELHLPLPWGTMARVALATAFMGLATVSALELGVNWPLVLVLIAPGVYLAAILAMGVLRAEDLGFMGSGAPVD